MNSKRFGIVVLITLSALVAVAALYAGDSSRMSPAPMPRADRAVSLQNNMCSKDAELLSAATRSVVYCCGGPYTCAATTITVCENVGGSYYSTRAACFNNCH
jgi:hypothetical protein